EARPEKDSRQVSSGAVHFVQPTVVIWPGLHFGRVERIRGTSGKRSSSRLLRARITNTAILNFGMCCWKDRLRSTVRNTSKSFSASASRRPFLIVVQPICGTVLTEWPFNSLTRRRSRHSSRRMFISARDGVEQSILGFLKESNHLVA